MKKILNAILVALLASALFGCTQNQNTPNVIKDELVNKKIKVVTTLFPQYDFTRQIVGDKAEIVLLLPPGAESHSFEPTPSDIISINKADVFIYTGKYMEPWAERIIQSIDSGTVNVLDASSGITLVKEEHNHDEDEHHDGEHEEEVHGEDGHNHEYDPHIWTSPVMAIKMVDNIASSLCYADPENASYYKANAESYKMQLGLLNDEFSEIVASGLRNKIYFGGRFALHYFIEEYGLEHESAYDNCSSETEPSARDMAHIIDEIKENNIPVIYYEELTDPKVSRSISEDTGAEMMLFHSCHNLSKKDFDSGVTYLDLMKQNAENLRKGLN
ncbi:MAG TPA: ABC transporter substrate-binding protein [Clostridiales bacterium]|nr:ABC transporter substrate-binding protein [Clostridiales bacterium]